MGRDEILLAIESPKKFLDFHLAFFDSGSLEGADRQQYILDIMREIKGIQDGIVRNDIVRILSEKLKVNEEDLIRVMKSQRVNTTQFSEQNKPEEERVTFTSLRDKAQIELLQLLVHVDPSVQNYVKEHITLELFTTPLLNKIASYVLDENLSMESSAIIEYFQDRKERDSVAKILFADTQEIPTEQIVFDCLKILKSIPLKEKIQSLRAQIREKESKGADPQDELDEVIQLRQELNDI
ncbi:MAG: hypothetical protein H8D58_03045 [Candidatus Marinimicrobia bacterium]|nr:hypothetical protein [Candidatus Neomarinimicrobiota bacterium]